MPGLAGELGRHLQQIVDRESPLPAGIAKGEEPLAGPVDVRRTIAAIDEGDAAMTQADEVGR